MSMFRDKVPQQVRVVGLLHQVWTLSMCIVLFPPTWVHHRLRNFTLTGDPDDMTGLFVILTTVELPSLTAVSLVIKGPNYEHAQVDLRTFRSETSDALPPGLTSKLTSVILRLESISVIYDIDYFVGRLGDASHGPVLTVLWDGVRVCACMYDRRVLHRDKLGQVEHQNECTGGNGAPPASTARTLSVRSLTARDEQRPSLRDDRLSTFLEDSEMEGSSRRLYTAVATARGDEARETRP
jgi:hypothetical protein